MTDEASIERSRQEFDRWAAAREGAWAAIDPDAPAAMLTLGHRLLDAGQPKCAMRLVTFVTGDQRVVDALRAETLEEAIALLG
jgi:hypothetical protein